METHVNTQGERKAPVTTQC